MCELLKAIKAAIAASGETRYRIAKESGVTQGQLSRLVSGERGLTIESVDKLADALGYKIVLIPKRRNKKGR